MSNEAIDAGGRSNPIPIHWEKYWIKKYPYSPRTVAEFQNMPPPGKKVIFSNSCEPIALPMPGDYSPRDITRVKELPNEQDADGKNRETVIPDSELSDSELSDSELLRRYGVSISEDETEGETCCLVKMIRSLSSERLDFFDKAQKS